MGKGDGADRGECLSLTLAPGARGRGSWLNDGPHPPVRATAGGGGRDAARLRACDSHKKRTRVGRANDGWVRSAPARPPPLTPPRAGSVIGAAARPAARQIACGGAHSPPPPRHRGSSTSTRARQGCGWGKRLGDKARAGGPLPLPDGHSGDRKGDLKATWVAFIGCLHPHCRSCATPRTFYLFAWTRFRSFTYRKVASTAATRW